MKKLQLNKVSITTLTQNFEAINNTKYILGGIHELANENLQKLTDESTCNTQCRSQCFHCSDNA